MKDSILKLRIRKILWAQGFHCPLEVDLSHFEYEDIGQSLKRSSLTDIDVLGIRFEPDLRLTMIIADCKSGKESEPNRMFWLKGVMDFFGAKEGILVKTVLHPHARALAPKLGIRALDEKGLGILEKSLALDSLAIDVSNPVIHNKMSALWNINIRPGQKLTEKQLAVKKVHQYLQYTYWMVDEYRNIQTTIDQFSRIRNELNPEELESKYLVFVGIQRLALSILRMANSVAIHNVTDIKYQSRIYLLGGVFMTQDRVATMKLVNKYFEQIGVSERVNLELPYFDELVEIVNRIILNSSHAVKILQHLDAIIIERLFGSKQDIEIALGTVYSTEALVLAKRIATMFQKYSGLDEGFFEELRNL